MGMLKEHGIYKQESTGAKIGLALAAAVLSANVVVPGAMAVGYFMNSDKISCAPVATTPFTSSLVCHPRP
jgi:hypothetical protein